MTKSPFTTGYTFGTSEVARSPVTLKDFDSTKNTAWFGDDDVEYLRQSRAVVGPQVEAILDVWYGFVGCQPHLLASFVDKSVGKPLGDDLGAVRTRFGPWIVDTARAEYDEKWLDYQHEIGLGHQRAVKNRTDKAVAAQGVVPFRGQFLWIVPATTTLKPLLAKQGHSTCEVEKMHAAWVKSCLLKVTLWSQPYINAGEF